MYMSAIEYFRSGIDLTKRTPEEAMENVCQYIRERLDEISKDPEIIKALKAFKEKLATLVNDREDYLQVGEYFYLDEEQVLSYTAQTGLGVGIKATDPAPYTLINDFNLIELILIERRNTPIGLFPVNFIDNDGTILFTTVLACYSVNFGPHDKMLTRLNEIQPN